MSRALLRRHPALAIPLFFRVPAIRIVPFVPPLSQEQAVVTDGASFQARIPIDSLCGTPRPAVAQSQHTYPRVRGSRRGGAPCVRCEGRVVDRGVADGRERRRRGRPGDCACPSESLAFAAHARPLPGPPCPPRRHLHPCHGPPRAPRSSRPRPAITPPARPPLPALLHPPRRLPPSRPPGPPRLAPGRTPRPAPATTARPLSRRRYASVRRELPNCCRSSIHSHVVTWFIKKLNFESSAYPVHLPTCPLNPSDFFDLGFYS